MLNKFLEASPNGCEEASVLSRQYYIPCNRPATRLIKLRELKPARMCEMCADHNIRNRGATDVGPFVPSSEEEYAQRIEKILGSNDPSEFEE